MKNSRLQNIQFRKAIKLNPKMVIEARKRLTISDRIRSMALGLCRTNDYRKAEQVVKYSWEVNNLLRKELKI